MISGPLCQCHGIAALGSIFRYKTEAPLSGSPVTTASWIPGRPGKSAHLAWPAFQTTGPPFAKADLRLPFPTGLFWPMAKVAATITAITVILAFAVLLIPPPIPLKTKAESPSILRFHPLRVNPRLYFPRLLWHNRSRVKFEVVVQYLLTKLLPACSTLRFTYVKIKKGSV